MVENQEDSTDANDNENFPVTVVLDRLDKTPIAELTKNKNKATPLNYKNPNKRRVTLKGEKSAPKRLDSKNVKRCTVCGHISSKKNLSRHMRTHTGEKIYRCNRCGRRFTSAVNLMKHDLTHIADFQFHCRACFHGFSLKAQAVEHEKHCRKLHYECYLCKKFVSFSKCNLEIHLRKHTGDKPFHCEICMKVFFQKQNLKRHLNTIHA